YPTDSLPCSRSSEDFGGTPAALIIPPIHRRSTNSRKASIVALSALPGNNDSAMRSRWIVALETVAVSLFFVLVALLGARLVRGAPDGAGAAWLILAAVAGYAAADVASGLTHWFCDTFFREDTPGIGPVLIFPFREHHRDPAGMTRHGFLELTGNSCLGVAPLLGLAAWRPWS